MHRKTFQSLYKVFYSTLCIMFARKIVRKITSMFDIPAIPVYHEDSSGWFAIRVYGKYYWWDGFSRVNAMDLAQRLSTHQAAKGHIEVVEMDEPVITLIQDTPGFTRDDVYDLEKIYEEWTDEE